MLTALRVVQQSSHQFTWNLRILCIASCIHSTRSNIIHVLFIEQWGRKYCSQIYSAVHSYYLLDTCYLGFHNYVTVFRIYDFRLCSFFHKLLWWNSHFYWYTLYFVLKKIIVRLVNLYDSLLWNDVWTLLSGRHFYL